MFLDTISTSHLRFDTTHIGIRVFKIEPTKKQNCNRIKTLKNDKTLVFGNSYIIGLTL